MSVTRKSFWITAVVALVCIPAALIAWWMLPQWERIPDVTRASELVLHPRKHQNNIYGIEIYVHGEIEGEAELRLGVDASRVFKLSGAVDIHYTGDWYSDEVRLAYKPVRVTGGSLKLRYRFYPSYPTDPL